MLEARIVVVGRGDPDREGGAADPRAEVGVAEVGLGPGQGIGGAGPRGDGDGLDERVPRVPIAAAALRQVVPVFPAPDVDVLGHDLGIGVADRTGSRRQLELPRRGIRRGADPDLAGTPGVRSYRRRPARWARASAWRPSTTNVLVMMLDWLPAAVCPRPRPPARRCRRTGWDGKGRSSCSRFGWRGIHVQRPPLFTQAWEKFVPFQQLLVGVWFESEYSWEIERR